MGTSLNFMNGGQGSIRSGRLLQLVHAGPVTLPQRVALDRLSHQVREMLQDKDAKLPEEDWSSFLQRRRTNYCGEVLV